MKKASLLLFGIVWCGILAVLTWAFSCDHGIGRSDIPEPYGRWMVYTIRNCLMKLFARINLSSVALRRGILVSYLALAAGCASTLKVDNAPVAALDLSRYLGEWYEIARFDHSFERGVEQAKANYTQNADGTIEVVNTSLRSATAWLRHR